MNRNIPNEVASLLRDIEKSNRINIIHAVVVGSRQFGYSRENSDWDIRFIYADLPQWYFKTNDKSNTITFKSENYDVLGFNMEKSVDSVVRSNGLFYEWMTSPLVIKSSYAWFKRWETFMETYYNPKRMYHFYYTIGSKAMKRMEIKGFDQKHFLIAVRAICSMELLERYGKVEQNLVKLVKETFVFNATLKDIIAIFIEDHMSGNRFTVNQRVITTLLEYLSRRYDEVNKTKYDHVIPQYVDPRVIDLFHMDTVLTGVNGVNHGA